MMGIQGLYKTKKIGGGSHHLLLVYDTSKLSTVYVVKSPFQAFSGHFFRKVKIFFKCENLKKNAFNKK